MTFFASLFLPSASLVCIYVHLFTLIQPVNMFPANSLGFYDVYGNVWEWLEDHYNGLPGFKTHYLYEDYSATYCDGKHNVLVVRDTCI